MSDNLVVSAVSLAQSLSKNRISHSASTSAFAFPLAKGQHERHTRYVTSELRPRRLGYTACSTSLSTNRLSYPSHSAHPHHRISFIVSGATITGGIQNIAGLLPSLGTQHHIGTTLTNGYLYTVVTPMLIFSSFGVARAVFKTFIAGVRFWPTWDSSLNEPISIFMVDKDGQHLVKARLDELIKDLHIDKSRITISYGCTRRNVTMILLASFPR